MPARFGIARAGTRSSVDGGIAAVLLLLCYDRLRSVYVYTTRASIFDYEYGRVCIVRKSSLFFFSCLCPDE